VYEGRRIGTGSVTTAKGKKDYEKLRDFEQA